MRPNRSGCLLVCTTGGGPGSGKPGQATMVPHFFSWPCRSEGRVCIKRGLVPYGEASMKFGIRKPSLKRRIAARTSVKRYVRHSLGLKAPRGWGWITNPRKAAYNRVYNRTTISADSLLRGKRRRSRGCTCCSAYVFLILSALMVAIAVIH